MKTTKKQYHPQTESVVGGYTPSWSEGSAVPPVYRTSTFVFKNAEEGKRAFQLAWGMVEPSKNEISPLIYSRVNNPNTNIVEDRLLGWDRAEAAAVFSSGMGAIACTCFALLRPGDQVYYADPIYGGTDHFFRVILPAWGVECIPFSVFDSEKNILARAAGLKKLRMVYSETCTNPTLSLVRLKLLKAIADQATQQATHLATRLSTKAEQPVDPVPVVVDNTFLGPIFCKPLAHAADIVVYSATKFIGGHSDLIAGAVLGSKHLIQKIKTYRTVMGTNPDPETSWLLTRSLATLELRMNAQQTTALKVAQFLKGHPQVKKVYYPHPEFFANDASQAQQSQIYREQCEGYGSVISFDVQGGESEAFDVLNRFQICKLAVSLGGVETLAQHPFTMTHAELPSDQKIKNGITESMIRYSVGLEHADDLIQDLDQALRSKR